MKKSRFTDSQIMAILKQAEAGIPVPELCPDTILVQLVFTSGELNLEEC